MTTDSTSVRQLRKATEKSPHKFVPPVAGPSIGLPTTLKMSHDGYFEVPDKLQCEIVLEKTPILKLCSEHKISYRLLCLDYDITPDPNFKSLTDDESDNDESGDDMLQNNSPILKDMLNSSNSRKSKQKVYQNGKRPGRPKRKNPEDLRALKKVKLVPQSPIYHVIPKNLVPYEKSTQSTAKKKLTNRTLTKSAAKSKVSKTTVTPPTLLNGFTEDFQQFCHTSNSSFIPVQKTSSKGKNTATSASNTTISNKRSLPMKAKDKHRAKRRNPVNANKSVIFLGEMFREMDLFDDYCDCENDCEIDELSMAFEMLVRSKGDDQLPKDLRFAIGSIIFSDDEESFDDVLPSERDVLRQVQQEAQEDTHTDTRIDTNDAYVDEFLLNAGLSYSNAVPNVNGHPESPTRTSTTTVVTESLSETPKLVKEQVDKPVVNGIVANGTAIETPVN